MITRIEIKNYQRCKNLELDLSPNITTLIGETDEGKSSIIRAIIWAFLNVSPTNFTTWGEAETSVTVFIDNHKIVRLKNKKENCYILDGAKFSAVGRTVPKEVQDILKISADSFQEQFDPFFWFTLKGSELAKKINSIVNLKVIDFSFGEIAAELKKLKSVQSVYVERLEEKKKDLALFENLEDIEEKLQRLKREIGKVDSLKSDVLRLGAQIEKNQKVEAEVENNQKRIDCFEEFEKQFEVIIGLRKEIKKLTLSTSQYKALEEYDEVKIDEDFLKCLEDLLKKVEKERKSIKLLQKNIEGFQNLEEEIKQSNNQIKILQKKIEIQLKKGCPLCGAKKQEAGEVIDECCINYNLAGEVE